MSFFEEVEKTMKKLMETVEREVRRFEEGIRKELKSAELIHEMLKGISEGREFCMEFEKNGERFRVIVEKVKKPEGEASSHK